MIVIVKMTVMVMVMEIVIRRRNRRESEGDGGLERIGTAEEVLGRVARCYQGWKEMEMESVGGDEGLREIGRYVETLGLGLPHYCD